MYSTGINGRHAAFETSSIHADADLDPDQPDVTPPISVATTFIAGRKGDFGYSRLDAPTRRRVEAVLGAIEGTPQNPAHAVLYSSGLAAMHGALLSLSPRRVFMEPSVGYHGARQVMSLMTRSSNVQVASVQSLLNSDGVDGENYGDDASPRLGPGDVVWLETPLNPNGHIYNISELAAKTRSAGAKLVVDSTFAPPPLQMCLHEGADIVVHSATKSLGGHSDLLCGVCVVRTAEERAMLMDDRSALGSTPGNLETWLLLRSLRTLKLRVTQQSRSTEQIVAALQHSIDDKTSGSIKRVIHPLTAQRHDLPWIRKQMPGGLPAVFSILCHTPEQAEAFPKQVKYFVDATSLGGCESLCEWRYKWDVNVDPRLVRFSVGLEDTQDLLDDL